MNTASFLLLLVRSSLAASLLALLVVAAQWIFRRRLSPQWRCALWLLVAVRLVPFSFSSVTSVFNLVPAAVDSRTVVRTLDRATSVRATREAFAPVAPDVHSAAPAPVKVSPGAPEMISPLVEARPVLPRPVAARPVSRTAILFTVWAAGAAGLAGWVGYSSWRLVRRLRQRVMVTDPATLELLRECCAALGVRRAPRLAESAVVSSPALHGLFRPSLLLPAGFLRNYSAEELRFVFLHELAHIKRRDLALNWIMAALQALHWFNPVVWYAFARWRLDREIACDALALSAAGEEQNRQYGRTILRLLEPLAEPVRTPALVGILEDKRQLRQRLRMIATFVPARRWSVTAVVLLATLGVVGLTDAQNSTSPASAPAGTTEFKKFHTLTIKVVDAATGQPIEGATVEGWEGPRVEGKTDASGVAKLAVALDIPMPAMMNRFSAVVMHPDYASRETMWIYDGGSARETLPDEYTFKLEHGSTIGGVVTDARGAPVTGATISIYGSDYKGYSLGTGAKSSQEFPMAQSKAAIVTDEHGAWKMDHVAKDLQKLEVEVSRPGGSRARFSTSGGQRAPGYQVTVVVMERLRASDAKLVLPAGVAVHGIVVDEAGQPLSGVQLRVRNAEVHDQPFKATAGADGRFELPDRTEAKLLITGELAGYAMSSAAVAVGEKAPEVKLTLHPAKPLIVRFVGDNDQPVAGAQVRVDDYNSGDQVLGWTDKTDAEGRVTWATAPDQPVLIGVMPTAGFPVRAVRLQGDGTEHVVRVRRGADKEITFAVHAVDAETGKPLENFEVWRQMGGGSFQQWGDPVTGGAAFQNRLTVDELPHGFVPRYRVQIRAVGYGPYTSLGMDFAEGDQDLTFKLARGSKPAGAPVERPRVTTGVTPASDPKLFKVGEAVVQLLTDGDVAAFVQATVPTGAEWKEVLPANTPEKNNPLGDVESRAKRSRQAATDSAERLLADLKRAGVDRTQMSFAVKGMSGRAGGFWVFKTDGAEIRLPHETSLHLVLTGEVKSGGAAGGHPGEYDIFFGDIDDLPAGWRLGDGFHWWAFPAGVGDVAFRKELDMINRVGAGMMEFSQMPRLIDGEDDPALNTFAAAFADLLQHRDLKQFTANVVLTREAAEAYWKRAGWGSAKRADEAIDQATREMEPAVDAVLAQMDRAGIDLSDASIKVQQAVVENPSFTRFGSLDGLRSMKMRLILHVDSPRTSKIGKSLSGDYALLVEDGVRVDDHWVMVGPRFQWLQFPAGVLSGEDQSGLKLENYLAEHRVFPVGYQTPDIDLIPAAGAAVANKLSAYRGKVVMLEFWASWCGPCQEPMTKLQKIREEHPDWGDRIQIVTVSIDDQLKEAQTHIADRNWTTTPNAWAGEGGWKAPAAKAFRINGVPTLYVLDRDGKVAWAGHPGSPEGVRVVENQLR